MKTYPWQNELMEKLLRSRETLPHALILKGRSGTGKLDFANRLAQSLLCESPHENGEACDACQACSWFANGLHPDFRKIEPEVETSESGKKSNRITIDPIRSLSAFTNVTTHRNGYRIILIHPADAMNLPAANALLKTLEEPPGKTLFILVTSRPNQLLPTVVSRCHALAMPFPKPIEGEAWLREKGITNPAPFLAEAGHAPLAALELASEDSSLKNRFLNEIASSSLDPIAVAEAFQKTELSLVLRWLQKWCHDLASFAFSGKIRYFPDFSDRIRAVSAKTDKIGLARFQRKLCDAQRISNHPVNARLFIEETILTYRALTESK